MTEVIFRIAGQVLEFLKDEAIYAKPYGDAITSTWTAQKYDIVTYDRNQATFKAKTNTSSPPKLRELLLFYTPLNNSLNTALEPTKVEIQYYSKHPSSIKTPPGPEEHKNDLDKLVNGMYFANWDYQGVVARFKRAGFKIYNGGMNFTNLDLDAIVKGSVKDDGTPCHLKVRLDYTNGLVVTDLRIT